MPSMSDLIQSWQAYSGAWVFDKKDAAPGAGMSSQLL